jgi:hypothetical protein
MKSKVGVTASGEALQYISRDEKKISDAETLWVINRMTSCGQKKVGMGQATWGLLGHGEFISLLNLMQ